MTGEQALREQAPIPTDTQCQEDIIVSACKDLKRFAILVANMDDFSAKKETLEKDQLKKIASSLENVVTGLGKTRPITLFPESTRQKTNSSAGN